MGRAQGEALAERIRGARGALERLEAFTLGRPWWLPYPLYRRLAERRAWRALRGPLAREHASAGERLAGLAEGSGLRLDSLALLNALEAVMSSVRGRVSAPSGERPAGVAVPGGACSALAVRGRRSAGGEPAVARNFDYLPLVQPFYCLRESRPAGGLRALEFTVAPLAGAVDGINEGGLCVTYNYGYTVEASRPHGPISLAISAALATCAAVAEAAELIRRTPRWGGGLLMLADASGDIASLELSSTRSALRRPAPGEDALWHTNVFSDPAMKEVEAPPEAVFDERAPSGLRGKRVLESGERRRDRLAELLDGRECLDPDGLLAVLSDHGPAGMPGDASLCAHSSYWFTTAALQYFPRRRGLRASFSTACEARFVDLSL